MTLEEVEERFGGKTAMQLYHDGYRQADAIRDGFTIDRSDDRFDVAIIMTPQGKWGMFMMKESKLIGEVELVIATNVFYEAPAFDTWVSKGTISNMIAHPDTTPAARDVLTELLSLIDAKEASDG